jgi:hypothetical protein
MLLWADSTTPSGRLTLPVIGGISEFERELRTVSTKAAKLTEFLPDAKTLSAFMDHLLARTNGRQ